MMEPRLVVDAIRELTEHDEILRTEIELAVGTSEIKPALRRQFPLRIFSPMPLPFGARNRHQQWLGRQIFGSLPEQGFARLQLLPRDHPARTARMAPRP